MSGPFGSSQWMYKSGDYEIDQSLRFNDDDSAYLSWTPASAGNRKTWTWSGWVKCTEIGTGVDKRNIIFASYGGSSSFFQFGFSEDGLHIYELNGSSDYGYATSRVFRDTSAWYHIQLVVDTTETTEADRVRLYINGDLESFPQNYGAFPLNYDGANINRGTYPHQLGRYQDQGRYSDFYLAEVHFVDGQALTPADFGETGTYGEWKPIEYEGTYGTNGFYLSFAGAGIMTATGGNSTATDGSYKAASFTADGTFTPSADGFVEYLVVGGGGNGAGFGASSVSGGGGGAGGYRTGYLAVTGGTGYSITVGAATEDSVFSSITSAGGGNGGQLTPTSGGSGGGSAAANASGAAGISGQGNAGGTGNGNWGYTTTRSGGGGGSGGAGGNADNSNGGAAGAGTANSITGSSVTYAAGGEGVAHTRNTAGTPGAANTGNGGGGTGGSGGNSGGAGGSGIVIIRYKFQ